MRRIGLFLIISGLIIIFLIFGPVIIEEIRYLSYQWGGVNFSLDVDPRFPESGLRRIAPVDEEFGIVIEEINLNAEIFPEIDANDPEKFLPILRKGVAHAKGSAYPDEEGNVFLFGHSTDAFYNVAHYNAVFFLIGKLENGDLINIFFKDKRYQYEVIDKVVVDQEEISSYLEKFKGQKTVTLQTCYPPGTTLRRLLVIGKAVD